MSAGYCFRFGSLGLRGSVARTRALLDVRSNSAQNILEAHWHKFSVLVSSGFKYAFLV